MSEVLDSLCDFQLALQQVADLPKSETCEVDLDVALAPLLLRKLYKQKRFLCAAVPSGMINPIENWRMEQGLLYLEGMNEENMLEVVMSVDSISVRHDADPRNSCVFMVEYASVNSYHSNSGFDDVPKPLMLYSWGSLFSSPENRNQEFSDMFDIVACDDDHLSYVGSHSQLAEAMLDRMFRKIVMSVRAKYKMSVASNQSIHVRGKRHIPMDDEYYAPAITFVAKNEGVVDSDELGEYVHSLLDERFPFVPLVTDSDVWVDDGKQRMYSVMFELP